MESSFSGASVNLGLRRAAKWPTPREEAIPPRSWEPCFPPSGQLPTQHKEEHLQAAGNELHAEREKTRLCLMKTLGWLSPLRFY